LSVIETAVETAAERFVVTASADCPDVFGYACGSSVTSP
jgi:hypothetical protein